MVSLGRFELGTSYSFDVLVLDASNVEVTRRVFEVTMTNKTTVMRRNALIDLRFVTSSQGIWSVVINSGPTELARLPVEVRLRA